MHSFRALATTLLFVSSLAFSHAAKPEGETEKPMSPEEARQMIEKKIEAFGWTRTGKGKLGSWAEIEIPKGYRFTGKSGTKQLMSLYGNIPSDSELGTISPEDLSWSVLFDFEESGYVKDTDKDKLDADAMLKQMKEGQAQANEQRAAQGLSKLFLDGWAVPPRYNETTHNLEWAIKLHSDQGPGTSINYLTKLLGRKGVMHVTLLVDPQDMETALPAYQKLLTGFGYTTGQSYAEYRQGDKVAQYTLAGLVTAGAGVALLKSGWLAKLGIIFAKLGKAAYLLIIGVLAGLKKLAVRLFGKSESQPMPPPPPIQ